MTNITINRNDLQDLIGYVHTLLDFIDVNDFEDEEDAELVSCGYDNFVKPVIEKMDKININIEQFLQDFRKQYKFLYDARDNVAGYREALEAGDEFIKNNPDFIREFVMYRGDFISSDREVVAFMFALDNLT